MPDRSKRTSLFKQDWEYEPLDVNDVWLYQNTLEAMIQRKFLGNTGLQYLVMVQALCAQVRRSLPPSGA